MEGLEILSTPTSMIHFLAISTEKQPRGLGAICEDGSCEIDLSFVIIGYEVSLVVCACLLSSMCTDISGAAFLWK